MYPLGLSGEQREQFERGLRGPYYLRTRIDILDMDQNVLGSTSGRVLSGQVDIDSDADIARSAGMTMLDPDHMLNLDSSATFGGSLFLDRMVRIWYGVKSREYPHWVDVPLFTGPIDNLERDGDVVSLSAQGKESLLFGPASTHRTWPAGSYKTTVLRELLQMFGEAHLEIPHKATKITRPVSIAPDSIPWEYVKAVARSWGGDQIMYDGMGYARLVTPENTSRWFFTDGDNGTLLTKPKITYIMERVRNFVVVTGAEPATGGKAVQALAHAPSSHPLSAANLGRNGWWRYLREDIQDETITTEAAAKALADRTLEQRLMSALQVDYAARPIPHLEPYDVVTVGSGPWSISAPLNKYTMPLVADGTMTVGRNYTVNRHYRDRPEVRKGPRR